MKEKICSLHPIYQVEYDILFFQQESSSGRSDRVHTYNEDSRTKVLVEVEEKTTL